MILKPSELALLRRGRRWLTLPADPGWEPGTVVKLRASGQADPFVITVTDIVEDGARFKVTFTPGDAREDEVYIAAGWPDYTSDPFRAMRDEPPPMPETAQERKSRTAWLALVLRHTTAPPSYGRARSSACSQTRPERVSYAAGSPEARMVIRRLAGS